MKKAVAVLLAATVVVGACAPVGGGRGGNSNYGTMGAGAGAVLGGFLGYQFGGGTGKLLFALAGAALGAYAGQIVGQRLDPGDIRAYHDTTYRALSEAPDGQALAWDNPETGNGGTVAPTRSFTGVAGQSCRDFDVMIRTQDGVGIGRGAACQQVDGTWQTVNQLG